MKSRPPAHGTPSIAAAPRGISAPIGLLRRRRPMPSGYGYTVRTARARHWRRRPHHLFRRCRSGSAAMPNTSTHMSVTGRYTCRHVSIHLSIYLSTHMSIHMSMTEGTGCCRVGVGARLLEGARPLHFLRQLHAAEGLVPKCNTYATCSMQATCNIHTKHMHCTCNMQ